MNNDIELTLLSKEDVWGEKSLDVLKNYGPRTAITDLCVLTGSYLCEDTDYNIDEDRSLTGRTSWFWTRSDNGVDNVRVVNGDGNEYSYRTIPVVLFAQLCNLL